jgi:Lipoprotein amino terminal region
LLPNLSDPLQDPNICGFAKCEIEDEKFGFSQNFKYRYALESSHLSMFDGTDNNDPLSQVHISGFAEITFPTKCQGELKLTGIRLKHRNVTLPDDESEEKSSIGDIVYDDDEDTPATVQTNLNVDEKIENVLHPRSAQFAEDLEKFAIRFDFHDGVIHEICPKSGESVWITNLKRGIISTLQNTMSRFDLDHNVVETDISGKCEVNYEFFGTDRTSILVKKTKALSSCQNRNKFKSFLQTTPYEFRRVRRINFMT